MKDKSLSQKTTQYNANKAESSSAGPGGIAITPPDALAPIQLQTETTGDVTPQTDPNHTGLPDGLKNGVEALSGFSLDDVRVHYNSSKPAQLQALAYTQGTDIHVAPGQERHLPHEAWHVVQQAQGRVKPTFQMKGGVNVNDDAGLEKEADVIGAKATQFKLATEKNSSLSTPRIPTSQSPVQRQALIIVEDKDDEKVVISASGEARDFSGGTKAKNNGWNGVRKYSAVAKVGNTVLSSGMINNQFIVAQAGHILAEQNGGDGDDPENVFAQEGGVNNGPYRSRFENPMRKALNNARQRDDVYFRAVLYGYPGERITKGPLEKISDDLDGSSEDSDFDIDDI